MEYKGNEIKAGIVVLVAIAVGTWLVFRIGNFQKWAEDRYQIQVLFRSISGVKPNDPVQYAGMEIGRVKTVDQVQVQIDSSLKDRWMNNEPGTVKTTIREDIVKYEGKIVGTIIEDYGALLSEVDKQAMTEKYPPHKETRVLLRLELPATYKVYRDAAVKIDKSLTGNIVVTVAPGWRDMYQEGDFLAGSELTLIEEIAGQVKQVTVRVEGLIGDVRAIVGKKELRDNILASVENVKTATDDLKAAVETAQGILDENRPNLSEAIANVKDGSADLKGILSENKEGIASIVRNVDEATAKINSATDKVPEVIENVDAFTVKINDLVEANRSNIDESLASLRILMQDAKVTMAEIRSRPWRLIHKPDEEMMSLQGVYEAARNYNDGASALDHSLTDLLVFLQVHPTQEGVSDAELQRLVGRLKAGIDRFQGADQEFWDILQEDRKKK